jgi:hypothetical protein
MKKFILPLCILAIVACNKKEDPKEAIPTTPATFSKTNLVGTWSIMKENYYTTDDDSLSDSYELKKGEMTFTFESDNTLSIREEGDLVSVGYFSTGKLGSKDLLILTGGGDSDTEEVVSFSAQAMVLSDKMSSINWGDDEYSKLHLAKH